MRGEERIEIGGVARAHGIRGEVVIVTHNPDSDLLADCQQLFVGEQAYQVAAARFTHRGWLVVLEGVTDRNAAERLAGAVVSVGRESIPLEDDQFILDDLIGCTVTTVSGEVWGEVTQIDIGFQDRMIIIDHARGLERMLPIVDEFLVEVDIAQGKVVIDPPDGIPTTEV